MCLLTINLKACNAVAGTRLPRLGTRHLNLEASYFTPSATYTVRGRFCVFITGFRFCRTDEQIKAETDPETKLKLRRFLRGLKNAHADVTKYREFYSKFEYADESEYDSCTQTCFAGCHRTQW